MSAKSRRYTPGLNYPDVNLTGSEGTSMTEAQSADTILQSTRHKKYCQCCGINTSRDPQYVFVLTCQTSFYGKRWKNIVFGVCAMAHQCLF